MERGEGLVVREGMNGNSDETAATALHRMIGLQEYPSWSAVNNQLQSKVRALTCAAMALDVEDQERL